MATKIEVIQANDVEDLQTAVNAFLTDETIALADLVNVTINDVKGRPTAVITYDDGL